MNTLAHPKLLGTRGSRPQVGAAALHMWWWWVGAGVGRRGSAFTPADPVLLSGAASQHDGINTEEPLEQGRVCAAAAGGGAPPLLPGAPPLHGLQGQAQGEGRG